MVKIAIIGPGAVGSTITAWLMQNASHSVVVAARSLLTDVEVQTPERVLRVSPNVITHVYEASPVDWVLVTTKAYDSKSAAAWFEGLCDTHTVVAILQNGVEHVERFEPYYPRERILPVMVDVPAERTARGRVSQRRDGRMIVPEGALGARFVQLFSHTVIEVSQTSDFKSEVWRKLCVNAAGALSAIVLKPAVIARHDGVAQIMEGIVRECIAVGRAEGASLDDALAQNIIAAYRSTPDSINSIHADRLAGREMEIDARNGVVVRLGRKHGIPTPINDMVVALLEAASA
jgi:2-dehydropantoate 2-reductase